MFTISLNLTLLASQLVRGMGLHISRQMLERLGYELSIDPPEAGTGACFRISRHASVDDLLLMDFSDDQFSAASAFAPLQ